ncbi:MAG: NERD domain-containing protein [Rhizobacter sp.]|nr:NERD domain-containing protein [Rhizobacter sp.]
MRHVALSNHTREQADAAADKRQERYEAALDVYRTKLKERKDRALELATISSDAWTAKRYLAWFGSLLPRLNHVLSASPSSPIKEQASREELLWEIGGEGEQRVLRFLASRLPDEWVALSGYWNPGGEVDLLLVGPPGVMAIEIKYINGKVYCDRDHWRKDKYDKYGNLVETAISLADRRGRSPSAQLNAPADRLQRYLAERTPVKRVLRCVVLSHEASRIGGVTAPTVDEVVLLTDFYPEAVFDRVLTGKEHYLVDDLVRLIERDHAYHLSKKRTPKVSSAGVERVS